MISRRGFIGALASAAVAVAARLHLPTLPTPIVSRALHYRGVPLVFDQNMPSGAIYFMSKDGPLQIGFDPNSMRASVKEL